MKKILFIVPLFLLFSFLISCSETTDFSEIIELIDEQDEVDGEGEGDTNGDTNNDDEGDSDPDGDGTPGANCINGFAGGYACANYDLTGWMSTSSFGATAGNDCWGWTDPDSGKEYAIYGLDNGTAFVDISDPAYPVYVGKLNTNTGNSVWRDIKVYNNHAYIVSEASGHGMQVLDLTLLRDTTILPNFYEATAVYTEFGSAHNIVINEDTGFAYAVGTDTFAGGAHFIDLQDPANPVAAGGYSGSGYSHDAQVVTYNGPDTDYTDKEIYVGSNETEVVIVDVTDKDNPQLISSVGYSNTAYTHQGWFTEDLTYFITGDEQDELQFGNNTRTIIFDLTDLDNPLYQFQYLAPLSAIDHNGYVKGNFFYLASYTAGLLVYDITSIANSSIGEVGYFDVHPADNSASFDGAWSVYPYFDSGNIIVSDMASGLFIVKRQ